jgi:DNA-directed RNA polymerase specialized sigma24 family protein
MLTDGPGSVTRWLGELKGGDFTAAQPLWEKYFQRLVRLAHRKLQQAHHAGTDAAAEDAALSAFDSFCRAAAEGHFPQLSDRNDLWRLLVALTIRKATDQIRRERRQKRGGGRVLGAADLSPDHLDDGAAIFDQVVGPEPTPEFAAMVAEEYRRLLGVLGEEDLRQIAVWKLEGFTVGEIAGRLGCARRTVARRLEVIRRLWSATPP